MSEIVKKDNQSSTSNTPLPSDYAVVLQIVKDFIQDAQLKAVKAVNQALIFTYKEIGATIHKQQQSKDWELR